MTKPISLKTQPYKHQKKALLASVSRQVYALFMEQGTGKSWVTLATFLQLLQEGKVDALAVIAPKGVYKNWNGELRDHWPMQALPLDVAVWGAYRLKADNEALSKLLTPRSEKSKPRVLLLNVEGLSQPARAVKHKVSRGARTAVPDVSKMASVQYLEQFMIANRTLLVVDESTTIKRHKSKRSKNLIKIRALAGFRRILSGLPTPRNPLDIYGQALFLGRTVLPYPSYMAFENQYAVKETVRYGARAFQQVTGFRDLDRLQQEIADFSFRVTKKECLDLPPKIYQSRAVELTDEQVKAYNDLAVQFQTEVEDGLVTTALDAMSRSVRLHQVCCGHLVSDPDKDGKQVSTPLPNHRYTELEEVLDELDGPGIICATYKNDLAAVIEFLRNYQQKSGTGEFEVSEYWGGADEKLRQKSLQWFKSGKSKYMVMNPMVGGMGLTLNEASWMVFFSNSHNLEHRLQVEDRCHRIGQKKSVLYTDLYCPGTVEEGIFQNLSTKRGNAGVVVGDKPSDWIEWFKPLDLKRRDKKTGALGSIDKRRSAVSSNKQDGMVGQAELDIGPASAAMLRSMQRRGKTKSS